MLYLLCILHFVVPHWIYCLRFSLLSHLFLNLKNVRLMFYLLNHPISLRKTLMIFYDTRIQVSVGRCVDTLTYKLQQDHVIPSWMSDITAYLPVNQMVISYAMNFKLLAFVSSEIS